MQQQDTDEQVTTLGELLKRGQELINPPAEKNMNMDVTGMMAILKKIAHTRRLCSWMNVEVTVSSANRNYSRRNKGGKGRMQPPTQIPGGVESDANSYPAQRHENKMNNLTPSAPQISEVNKCKRTVLGPLRNTKTSIVAARW